MVSVVVLVVVVLLVIEPCVKFGTTGTAYTEGIVLKRINSKIYLFIVAQNYKNAVISVTNCAVTCVPAPAPTVPPVITISCPSVIVPGAPVPATPAV